ncbi:hypothetical protein DFH07DRAFT_968082 [Mycena maculata]|uniref:Uncharacterized protein n=1 Tax=Mycena maculata TaxID=230809 RepID=A0AAD7I3S7_9AGAR|nr:hypothetical protein DFH07DRAFT_968082 [Mycena maculata]
MALPDAASTNTQVGQVEPVDGANDPADANVDENVIANDDESIHEEEDESSATPPKTPPPITPSTTMPYLTNLADLTLHSPSSVIVGTPFSDIHSTRFEYPFPDKASTSSSPELSNTSPPQNSPTFPISPSPSSSALLSVSQPQLVLNPPPALQHYPASFPPPSELPNYSPTHPKMRAVNPPVPPALVKRRQRWSLGLGALSRKLSLRTGSASTGPVSPSPDPDDGHRRTMSDERAGGSKLLTQSPTGLEGPSTTQDSGQDRGGTHT